MLEFPERKAERAIFNGMAKSLRQGWARFNEKISGIAAEPFEIEPNEFIRDALEYLALKSTRLVSTLDNDALIKALELRENPRTAMQRLMEAMAPFVVEGVIESAEATLFRMEVIVRTETTNAFNRGRLIASRRPDADKIMQGWRLAL